MPSIVFLLSIFFVFFNLDFSNAEQSKEEQSIKGFFKEGVYEEVGKKNTFCPTGKLSWIEEGAKSSLMLGSTLVIPEIDQGTNRETLSDKCVFEYKSVTYKNKIIHEATRVCPKSKINQRVTLEAEGDNITYQAFQKLDKQSDFMLVRECKLKKISSI